MAQNFSCRVPAILLSVCLSLLGISNLPNNFQTQMIVYLGVLSETVRAEWESGTGLAEMTEVRLEEDMEAISPPGYLRHCGS